jgi:hypothetical protein
MDRFKESHRPTGVTHGPPATTLHALTQRIETLEAALKELEASAVRQSVDGKLHLPASSLRIEFGGTRLTMDSLTFTVELRGYVLIDSPQRKGQPHQPKQGASAGSSVQGIGAQTPSAGSWQSIAAGNAIENPLSLPSGSPVPTG